MFSTEMLHPQYLKDQSDLLFFVVLPVIEYDELIGDYEDLSIIAQRRNDKRISLNELKNRV